MKFYEFNDFPYYALIGANSQKEALRDYKEKVSDLDEDSGQPVEITEEQAKKKFFNAFSGPNDLLSGTFEAGKINSTYIFLIDGNLA